MSFVDVRNSNGEIQTVPEHFLTDFPDQFEPVEAEPTEAAPETTGPTPVPTTTSAPSKAEKTKES
jgi:hypothetical protein